jgi:flavin reductase (DIM6/NTAB) family NADH-FMN oxidoreductase RutF
MELNPSELSIRQRYTLMITAITPRPIAVVSTCSPAGAVNLAPFSFFNGVGSNPMTLVFCPANGRLGEEKDTLKNASPPEQGGTGEFVVGLATAEQIRKVVAASEPLPFGESEFERVGLTPVPSRTVRPPRLLESPVSFECRTLSVIRTHPGQPAGGNLVLGEVLHFFVRDDLIDDRFSIDADMLAIIGRMGGNDYVRCGSRFELPPGLAALDATEPGPG